MVQVRKVNKQKKKIIILVAVLSGFGIIGARRETEVNEKTKKEYQIEFDGRGVHYGNVWGCHFGHPFHPAHLFYPRIPHARRQIVKRVNMNDYYLNIDLGAGYGRTNTNEYDHIIINFRDGKKRS